MRLRLPWAGRSYPRHPQRTKCICVSAMRDEAERRDQIGHSTGKSVMHVE